MFISGPSHIQALMIDAELQSALRARQLPVKWLAGWLAYNLDWQLYRYRVAWDNPPAMYNCTVDKDGPTSSLPQSELFAFVRPRNLDLAGNWGGWRRHFHCTEKGEVAISRSARSFQPRNKTCGQGAMREQPSGLESALVRGNHENQSLQQTALEWSFKIMEHPQVSPRVPEGVRVLSFASRSMDPSADFENQPAEGRKIRFR